VHKNRKRDSISNIDIL